MFPERLKALRKEAGLTQKNIAQQMQIGQNSYSNWEKGIRTPIRPTIEKLAEVLNTSTSYLLGETNIKHPEKELPNMLPQRLKALRKEAGLTQKELADKLNISQAAYAQWENGVKKPARENLTTLANILDTSIDYLLDNTNSKHPEDDLSNVEILFRKTSKNMTPEQKEIFKKELLEFMEIRKKAFEEDEQ